MLTDTEIKRVKPLEKEFRMPDGRGLYLLVTPSGGKLWRWKYRFEHREKLMTFGGYPDVTLSDARARHSAARSLLASGVDPMAVRKVEKIATVDDSFKAVAEAWFKKWKVGKDERYADRLDRRMQRDVYTRIGNMPITKIGTPDIVAVVKAVEERGAKDIARRVLISIGQIYRYAIAHNKALRNPAADIKPADILKTREVVNFARVDAAEFPTLLRKIELYNGTPLTRLALKLMSLVWVRTFEMIGGEWSEIDWERSRWTIPKERMKKVKGSAPRMPHIVPLSTQAVEVLRLLQTLTGEGQYMFPGDRKNPTMSNNTLLQALERMGYAGDMTGHGFRGVASTILYENKFEEDHIETQLAHMKRNKVRAAYDHAKYLPQRTEMMQWWGSYVENALRGGKVLLMKVGA